MLFQVTAAGRGSTGPMEHGDRRNL